jgi:hypothetical protein
MEDPRHGDPVSGGEAAKELDAPQPGGLDLGSRRSAPASQPWRFAAVESRDAGGARRCARRRRATIASISCANAECRAKRGYRTTCGLEACKQAIRQEVTASRLLRHKCAEVECPALSARGSNYCEAHKQPHTASGETRLPCAVCGELVSCTTSAQARYGGYRPLCDAHKRKRWSAP